MKKKYTLALLSWLCLSSGFVFCEKQNKNINLEDIASPSALGTALQLQKYLGLSTTKETSTQKQNGKKNPFGEVDKNLENVFSSKSDQADNFGEGDPWDD
jgi:hypothetical protein